MHMPARLTRRTQILLDDERYDQLDRRAAGSGRSVASIIRDAIDHELEALDAFGSRGEAGRWLLADAGAPGIEPDWEDVKDDRLGALRRDAEDAG